MRTCGNHHFIYGLKDFTGRNFDGDLLGSIKVYKSYGIDDEGPVSDIQT